MLLSTTHVSHGQISEFLETLGEEGSSFKPVPDRVVSLAMMSLIRRGARRVVRVPDDSMASPTRLQWGEVRFAAEVLPSRDALLSLLRPPMSHDGWILVLRGTPIQSFTDIPTYDRALLFPSKSAALEYKRGQLESEYMKKPSGKAGSFEATEARRVRVGIDELAFGYILNVALAARFSAHPR